LTGNDGEKQGQAAGGLVTFVSARLLTDAEERRISDRDIPAEKSMARSTIFTTNRSQAVRLPKPVALPAGVRHVEITKLGRSRLVSPVGHSWDIFFDGPRSSDDFMTERRQPTVERRQGL
jgi:antitoxin VapB